MNRNSSHEAESPHRDAALPETHAASAMSDAPGSPMQAEQTAENPLVWRDEWCMGIPTLDADHRKLVKLVNHLLASRPEYVSDRPRGDRVSDRGNQPVGTDPQASETLSRFEALVDHLRHHFEREEALMLSIEYDDFQTHKCEHSLQLAELTDLRRRLLDNGQSGFTRESLQWVKRWCFDHFIAEDRRLALAYAEATRP